MAASIASGALIGGFTYVIQGKSFREGISDGAADGALWGGITALIGSTIGAIKYISNARGAKSGSQAFTTITKGQQFDRYGKLTGKYITDVGTSPSVLALPSTNTRVKTTLEATKSFRVITGIVADIGKNSGGGVQYYMRYSIKKLIQMGWLIVIP